MPHLQPSDARRCKRPTRAIITKTPPLIKQKKKRTQSGRVRNRDDFAFSCRVNRVNRPTAPSLEPPAQCGAFGLSARPTFGGTLRVLAEIKLHQSSAKRAAMARKRLRGSRSHCLFSEFFTIDFKMTTFNAKQVL